MSTKEAVVQKFECFHRNSFSAFLEWIPNNIKTGVATSPPRVEDDGCFLGNTTVCIDSLFFGTCDIFP